MRIAWFTPLSVRSAIGRSGAVIVRELSKMADVEVWCSDEGPSHATSVPVVRFRDAAHVDLARLAVQDLIVYNFGNYRPFHQEIFNISRLVPGVCVLHDFVMHHFFASYYLEELKAPEMYRAEMKRLYGASGEAHARQGRVWENSDVTSFPMFEAVLRSALGVITHSEFFSSHVAKVFAGPARYIPLAYEAAPSMPARPRDTLDIPTDRIVALTIGHVNANKLIEDVIESIAAIPDARSRLFYLVAGTCDPAYFNRLNSLVQRHQLGDTVRFLGYVDDDLLHTCLTHADFCINLRRPVTEGASASAIEEMLYGKPVIVSDTAFYKELPDDVVLKVDPADIAFGLKRALTTMLHRDRRSEIGQRARSYAESTFRADNYASELLSFAWEVRHARPVLALADRLGAEFRRMGVSADMQLIDTVSEECNSLFVEHRPGAERSQRKA